MVKEKKNNNVFSKDLVMARRREEEALNCFPLQTSKAVTDIMHPSPTFTIPPRALHHAPSCWGWCEISWGLATKLCFFSLVGHVFTTTTFNKCNFLL
jgi:hypothetical protein